MFPYRVKYNESESDINNYKLFYKIHQQYQNTFDYLETFGTFLKQFKNIEFAILYFV